MSSTKVIEKSSDRTVLSNRVDYFDEYYGPLGVIAPLLGGVLTWIVSAGITDIVFLETAAAFVVSGPIGLATVPVVASIYYSNAVSKKLREYTGVRPSKWEILRNAANMFVPAGQKIKLGKESFALEGKDDLNRLIGGSKSVYSDYYGRFNRKNPTHEVETELVFKPFGSYIKQTVIQSPAKVWDSAFDSTLEVHKFKTPPALKAAKAANRHSRYDGYDHSF